MARFKYRKSMDNLLDDLSKTMFVVDSNVYPELHYAIDADSVYLITHQQAFNIFKSQIPALFEELKHMLEVAP